MTQKHRPVFSQIQCLQPGSFPARCRNSSGNTKLLGREDQTADVITAHPTLWLSSSETSRASQISIPPKHKNSTAVMVTMVWKALRFIWWTRFPPLPTSPRPARLRAQSAERLQKLTTTEAKPMEEKYRTMLPQMFRAPKITLTTHSSQTHPMLMFLILTPPSPFSPR